MIRPTERVFEAGIEQPGDMGNRVEQKPLIAAVDLIEGDVRIEHPHGTSLTDQLLQQRHHRAFAQVVGILLKSQSEKADALGRSVEYGLDRALELMLVTGEHCLQERELE